MLTQAWKQLRPHPVQRQLWVTPKRFVGVYAGRGSGKTDISKRRLVRMLPVKKPWHDPRYFYGAPTQEQAKRIAWNDIIALVPPQWVKARSDSNLTIVTHFGSTLQVVGLDKPQRIEGVQWDGAVLDESSDLKPGTFDLSILPALTHRTGWCWRIGVPKRQGVGAAEFKDFCMLGESGDDPDIVAFTWPSSDILPPEALEYARRTMDIKDYREQFEACWETAGGGIFYAFDPEFNVRPCAYHPELPLVIGSDFNVDPMAWVVGHRYPNRMEWIDEIWLRDTNTQKTLETLWQRYQHHQGGFEFYGDATGQARRTSASASDYKIIYADERFSKTVHYPKANPPIKDRFSACNAMLCNAAGERRMFIDPKCKRLIKDLESRYYKPGTTDVADSGDLGHITDAMGYAVHRLFPMRVNIITRQQPVIVRSN